MKKRNLMFALCSAAVLGLVGCKDKEKPAEEQKTKEEQQTQATVITQEIVDSTLNAFNRDFKLSISGGAQEEIAGGVYFYQKQEMVEKHHFVSEKEIFSQQISAVGGFKINVTEFLAAGQTQQMLDSFDGEFTSEGYEKTQEDDTIFYSKSEALPMNYFEYINEYSHRSYDYDEDEEKYEVSLELGEPRCSSLLLDFEKILYGFVGKGSYDTKTGYIEINDDEIPANDLSSSYEVKYLVKVENGLISELKVNEIIKPEEDPFIENIEFEYGSQTVVLPSEEDIYLCSHEGGSRTRYETYNGKLYEILDCDECGNYYSFTECPLDSEGKYNEHEVKELTYERVLNHFIAEIYYNPVTNKVIDIEFDTYTRSSFFYNYSYKKGETTYNNVYGEIFELNGNLIASVNYEVDGVAHFDVLSDVIDDDSNQIISGTLLKEYYVGQVLSF